MSNISKIKLPNGNSYDIKDSRLVMDSNNKIALSMLPDVILGQMVYGGTFVVQTGSRVNATLSTNAKTKLDTTSNTVQLVNSASGNNSTTFGWIKNEGIYYICATGGTIWGIDFEEGDWLVSTGSAWKKIDNTDAVKDVNDLIGNIKIVEGDNVEVVTDTETNEITISSTDECVTSVGNHYSPVADSAADLTASATGGTASWNTSYVKGVKLSRDAKGHVTGVSVDSGKIPAQPSIPTVNNGKLTITDGTSTHKVEFTANQSTDVTATLDTVAFTGNYSDLSGTPTIPTVNDATLTIQMNGANKGTFTANAANNTTINLGTVVTDVSGKEDKSNKISSWPTITSNDMYPNASLVRATTNDLSDRITDIEGREAGWDAKSTVSASASGSSSLTANYLTIDGTVWKMPSGGGGGGTACTYYIY